MKVPLIHEFWPGMRDALRAETRATGQSRTSVIEHAVTRWLDTPDRRYEPVEIRERWRTGKGLTHRPL